MGLYLYKATDAKGKIVKGELDAKDEMDVSTQLAKLGYLPINISFKGEKSLSGAKKFVKRRIKRVAVKSLIVFTRQFATIIKAAVPIIEGMSVLADQSEDTNLKDAIYQVIHDIEGGLKLSEAMAKHPGAFNDLYVNSIVAGEAGGVLEKVLMRLADVLEEEQETKAGITSALQYPIMVSVALFVAVYVLSVYVVPPFVQVYSGMKVELPLPTRVMILVSKALKDYWYITLPSVIGSVIGIKVFINIPKGRDLWDSLKFKMPVIGGIYIKIIMLRFASMLNVLYQAGLPILKILDIVKITIGNVILAREVEGIKKDVADGKGISGGVLASKLFPRMVGYMISIGEKSGSLSTMLDSLCEYYTFEVKRSLATLSSLIEPIMTLVLGVVVMGMALAIFMPMWNMISVLKK